MHIDNLLGGLYLQKERSLLDKTMDMIDSINVYIDKNIKPIVRNSKDGCIDGFLAVSDLIGIGYNRLVDQGFESMGNESVIRLRRKIENDDPYSLIYTMSFVGSSIVGAALTVELAGIPQLIAYLKNYVKNSKK